MLEKKFTIYLRINKVNGKCYVGQTSNLKRREKEWRYLTTTYANKHIDEDREKYGLDNWAVEVLTTADNREEAWELEQCFIRDFNTIWPNGYNLAKGGGGPNGMHFSDEHKQKIAEAKKGKSNTKLSKHVYQYTLDGELVKIWPSAMECERNGFNHRKVSECCNSKRKTHKGYKWSYSPIP